MKKVTIFTAVLAVSLVAQFFVNTPQASAAAKCYIDLGNLKVASETTSCPSRASVDGSQGRIVYVDNNGKILNSAPATNECYALKSSGGGSFVTQTYTRQNCSDLETLRLITLNQECDAAGGTVVADSTQQFQNICQCPNGRFFNNGQCTVGETPGAGGSQRVSLDADCESKEVSSDNCGIIRYLVIIINILSGLVGLVVVVSIIIGGIQYSSAGSDPQKISAAKDRIRNAIIALLFFIFMYSIVNWLVPGGVLG